MGYLLFAIVTELLEIKMSLSQLLYLRLIHELQEVFRVHSFLDFFVNLLIYLARFVSGSAEISLMLLIFFSLFFCIMFRPLSQEIYNRLDFLKRWILIKLA